MTSETFAVASRALRLKRRGFSNEITSFLSDASSEGGVSKEAFIEKKEYFEKIWEEIVTDAEGCVNLLDDGDDEEGEIVESLKDSLEDLKYKKQRLI